MSTSKNRKPKGTNAAKPLTSQEKPKASQPQLPAIDPDNPNRVVWPGLMDKLQRALGVIECVDPTTRGLSGKQDPALSPRARDVLYVLADRGTHPNSLMTKGKIADAIQEADPGKPDVNEESIKPALRQLKTYGLVASKSGKGAGFWITEKGKSLASRLLSEGAPE